MAIRQVSIWLLLLGLLSAGIVSPAAAEIPDYGYNYSYWREAEPAPYPYLAERQIYGSALGIGDFNDPQDVFVSSSGHIYIADTNNNRIVRLNESGELEGVISSFDNAGKNDMFNKPSGIFVDRNGDLFVADTQNGRIVQLTGDGRLIKVFGAPVSSFIPKGFQYFPLKVSVDKTKRLYVVAQGAYEGIMEFDAQGNFRGYVGTNKVRFSPADLFWKRISTKEQAGQMQLFLPVEFANMDLDERGFIYAVSSEVNASRPIKRINPGGEDVLRREGYFDPVGDISAIQVDGNEQQAVQNAGSSTFVDVIADESGMYSGLDSRRNRIFTYNRDGNLLYQFGGVGMNANSFQKPTGIAMLGDRMAVLEGGMNRLIIFAPTRYGMLIRDGVKAHYNGKVDQAADNWEAVLKLNANFDIAYIGIGKALLKKGDNKLAMEYFENGNNRKYYSEALKRYRSEYMWNHFGIIMTVIIAVAAALVAARIYWVRRKPAVHFVDTGILKSPFRTMIRPFSGFWELKYENKGRIGIAVFILLLLVITMILKRQYSGFIVNFNKLDELNSINELKFIVFPFLLFCISNWSLTTLMDGEGKFKDIVMAAGYAMLPLVIIFLPQILLSNFITIDESPFYYLLDSIAYLWFIWLLFIGTMTVHQYSIGKTLLTLALTALVMAFLVFLGLLCFSLLQQMITFVKALYREIIVRL
ncbi:YIP1 family protein [Paenibacillus spongiae]|uniref:YIP1 family protein n=1 Tax=Paenibacillus spongiae TaxID=2909671 RepID=A0ABY5S8A9_9BACL|nr:YIP1 family protein [Paenibacillus spongiae]UVI30157.1 YIP1 family protein [Paenibacillus spongiae]